MSAEFYIDHLGHRGDGVARSGAKEIFIPYTLPGETVVAAGAGERLLPERIVIASSERVTPYCRYFGQCGGCAIQHASRAFELQWKRSLVVDALAQRGITTPVGDCMEAQGEGRRRVVLHVRKTEAGIVSGFMAARSHALVAIEACPLLVPALASAPALAMAIGRIVAPKNKPLDVQVTATRHGLDIDLRGLGDLPQGMRQRLADFANRENLARLSVHGEFLAARLPPLVDMGGVDVEIPAGGFLQATAAAENILADRIVSHLSKARHVADLFSGCGPFALRIARHARVHAVEYDKASIAALLKAVRNAQGLKPVTGEVRDLYRRPLLAAELDQYDAVVFDPPRNGAELLAQQMAQTKKLKTIMAVSCNPATFARDARLLLDGGWSLQEVTPVDQFRHAAHVELVAIFRR
ncbi:MAG: class I SAM-dependent RNA methyltransferase [Beijerinckiaceae bacterium]